MGSVTMTIPAFNASGEPLSGLTPVWYAYVDAATPTHVLTPPSVVEVGTGLYAFALDDNACGLLSFGGGAEPRFTFLGSATRVTFPAFDNTGAPMTGITPSVVSFVSGDPPAPTRPSLTFVLLSTGLYRIDGMPAMSTAVLDLGSSASPRRLTVSNVPDSSQTSGGSTNHEPPTVQVISPPLNTAIQPTTPLILEIIDPDSLLRRAMLTAAFARQEGTEVVHDGTGFTALYSGLSSRVPIANGYRYTLLRRGGWPSAPTITPYVVDVDGNENA